MTRERPERERLVAGRGRAVEQLTDLTRSFDAIVEAAQADPPDDEHDPDGATVGFERAQASALIDMTRARIAEFDAALERLDAGTYGVCSVCGTAIAEARLDALPTASTCVQCAPSTR